jgi:hypothetical protein
MAISLDSLIRKHENKAPRIIVHGPPGVGKTTLLASLPSPVLIDAEGGLGLNDIPHFPLATSFAEVLQAFGAAVEAGEFKTIIMDSIDHIEPLVWAETCRRNGWSTLEEPGFGKGPVAADLVWGELISYINSAARDMNICVAMTAHSQVRKFEAPEMAAYDRYEMKLHKRANALLQEKADLILFANFDTATTEIKEGMGKRTVGKGAGTRTLYAEKRPAFDAKNRHNLPAKLPLTQPFDWSQYAAAFPTGFFGA